MWNTVLFIYFMYNTWLLISPLLIPRGEDPLPAWDVFTPELICIIAIHIILGHVSAYITYGPYCMCTCLIMLMCGFDMTLERAITSICVGTLCMFCAILVSIFVNIDTKIVRLVLFFSAIINTMILHVMNMDIYIIWGLRALEVIIVVCICLLFSQDIRNNKRSVVKSSAYISALLVFNPYVFLSVACI